MSEATTSWNKLPAIQGKCGGCLNCVCGPRPSFFPPDGIIAVGFGFAALLRDGQPVYTEQCDPDEDVEDMTGAKAEELAAADPDHDWRIVMEALHAR